MSWDKTFDSYVSKFIYRAREMGYESDALRNQNIPNGKSTLISMAKDGDTELYEICYSGRDIIGRFIQ